ncbi:MAG: DinB family protein [Acidobacteriota bacterium]|nr:DinB family protein [Acidobacteriota bacterium]
MRLLLAITIATALAAAGQDAPKTPPTPVQVMQRQYDDVNRRLLAMAEDFPEDKYDFKPAPDVRTFAEQILHATEGNFYTAKAAKAARGEKVEWADPSREKYKTKAQVVAWVKESIAEINGVLKVQTDAQIIQRLGLWAGLLEHAGEHYGQLVVYYRANGLVPPETREQKK